MTQAIATITSKGQITIPAEIRRHLGVGKHDKIVFIIGEDGTVLLKRPRFPDGDSLVGVRGATIDPSLSWQEVLEIAHEDGILPTFLNEDQQDFGRIAGITRLEP